jgi:tetratricopeptide (TPR) repeat protein
MTSDPFEEAFNAACALASEGRYEEAARQLEELVRDRVDRRRRLAAAHGKLAGIYLFQLHDAPSAERHFRISTRFSPSSELASVGLFHALINQRRVDEAKAEMRRFLARKPSPEYQRILEETGDALNDDDE